MKIFTAFLFLFIVLSYSFSGDIIIDSNMTLEEAMKGSKAPQKVLDSMVLLNVKYYSFDGKIHSGQIVVNISVEEDVKNVFDLILKTRFKVNKVVPIVVYDWSDNASMADNNTSAFNYRFIAGTKRLSNHSFGRAVDINPFNNPVVYSSGRISPKGAKYKKGSDGVFSKDNLIVKEFLKLGWRWGGNFNSFKDYHHFDKSN